ncbi:MAG: pyrroloquinoline quinone biosynthesis protein PqqB [Chloroflexi bacterium]|nr:pyrroloquinoline quinone biosynthesis protein PqqB [Chloroflexota bacterium]
MIEVILLGAAQDAGLPQAGCGCERCRRAHGDPRRRQYVVCLGLIDRTTRQAWMIDATPDFREQLLLLQQAAPECRLAGILLTHAHMGHYTGLIQLGREAWNTRRLPIYATPRMCAFLLGNQPWLQLAQFGNIALHLSPPDKPIALASGLTATPLAVPHRDEWSDTMAFRMDGPERSLFYCPDIDDWERWDRSLPQMLADVDVALLDGAFFSPAELPGRNIAEIPHPLATDTTERATGADCDVRLIHLNHTNPLWDDGVERAWVTERGIGVGATGDRWVLG